MSLDFFFLGRVNDRVLRVRRLLLLRGLKMVSTSSRQLILMLQSFFTWAMKVYQRPALVMLEKEAEKLSYFG